MLHRERHLENVTGEPHATERGAEQRRLDRRAARDDTSVRDPQLELADVGAERAGAVVVLAMDVGRHHSPERDELGAGRDRREPAAGKEDPVQRLER